MIAKQLKKNLNVVERLAAEYHNPSLGEDGLILHNDGELCHEFINSGRMMIKHVGFNVEFGTFPNPTRHSNTISYCVVTQDHADIIIQSMADLLAKQNIDPDARVRKVECARYHALEFDLKFGSTFATTQGLLDLFRAYEDPGFYDCWDNEKDEEIQVKLTFEHMVATFESVIKLQRETLREMRSYCTDVEPIEIDLTK